MSEEGKFFSFEPGTHYAITYTCSTPGCRNPDGVQNYEVVTFVDANDIEEGMKCPACHSNMQRSNVVVAGGAHSEIWT